MGADPQRMPVRTISHAVATRILRGSLGGRAGRTEAVAWGPRAEGLVLAVMCGAHALRGARLSPQDWAALPRASSGGQSRWARAASRSARDTGARPVRARTSSVTTSSAPEAMEVYVLTQPSTSQFGAP